MTPFYKAISSPFIRALCADHVDLLRVNIWRVLIGSLRLLLMFVPAVFVLLLIKLKTPKKPNCYDIADCSSLSKPSA